MTLGDRLKQARYEARRAIMVRVELNGFQYEVESSGARAFVLKSKRGVPEAYRQEIVSPRKLAKLRKLAFGAPRFDRPPYV